MAFTVLLGIFDKRINSTKQPDLTGFATYNVNLKQGTDLESPAFLLEFNSEAFPKYNYMYISDIGHYLWVTDIISVRRNLWEIRAYIDRLATYKSQIMATSAYIEYGFNEDASGAVLRIPDTRQNIAQSPVISQTTADLMGGKIDQSGSGTYVLSAVGASGGVATYACSDTQLKLLLNTISTDITDDIDALVDGITEPMEAIQKILQYFTPAYLSQGNCIQAIRNCFWLPISLTNMPTAGSQHVYLGDFDTGVTCQLMASNTVITSPVSVSIPWPVDDWRRNNVQILMYVPFVGTISVPIPQCISSANLVFFTTVDCATGDVSISVYTEDGTSPGYTVYSGSTTISRGVPIGSSNVPATNFAAGAVNVVGGAIQAGGGLISGVYSGLTGDGAQGLGDIGEGVARAGRGYLQAVSPVIQCTGTLTGAAAFAQYPFIRLTLLYYPPVDDAVFSAVYGHPVFKVSTPVAGYCKTRGFSLAASGRVDDIGGVNTLMDSGVFIE